MAKEVKEVVVECELEWAKLREEDRDHGPNDGSDMAINMEAKKGIYVVNLMLTDESKAKMIEDGVPNKGLQAQLFKTDKNGRMYYKATRPHFNPKFKNQATGEQGVVIGSPAMFKEEGGEHIPWDWEVDGLVGNGSYATVKLDVWDGKITQLEKISISNQVVYVSDRQTEDRSVF